MIRRGVENKFVAVFLAFLFYSIISIIYFKPFLHNFQHSIFIPRSDPEQFIWFLNWWPYAILHGLNPFITYKVWSPNGFNLTWATSIPTLSLIATPLTIKFGPIFTYNLLSMLAAPLNSVAAFVLLRYLYKSQIMAFLGGYIFGYSSYVLGQLLYGHLNLDFVCLIPIALLFFILRVKNEVNKYYFIMVMAIIIFLEAGISTEILATSTLFGFISIAIFYIFDSSLRERLARATLNLITSYLVSVILLSPFIYFLMIGLAGVPKLLNSPTVCSADLLNYIIPTQITGIGRSVFSSIASRFTGSYVEEGAYIGIPLLLISAFSIRDYIVEKRKFGIALFSVLVVIVIFSFGPYLHVNGVITHVSMPWWFFTHVPLIRSAMPDRFLVYVSLVIAIIVTYWVSKKNSKRRFVYALASIAFIIPNTSTSLCNWGGQHVPTIFQSNYLKNKNVLILPYGLYGPSDFWQAMSGMKFNMVGGYVGFFPLPFRKMQVTSELMTWRPLSKHFKELFRSYCARFNVNYVVVCQGTPNLLVNAVKSEGWRHNKYGKCTAYVASRHLGHWGYYDFSGDTWGNYHKYNAIGKSVTIKTIDVPLQIYLSGRYIPLGVKPISVVIYNGKDKPIVKKIVPGEYKSIMINMKGVQKIKISAMETWVPHLVEHNSDTRHLSVGMKIKRLS